MLKTCLSSDEIGRLLKAVKTGDINGISQFVDHLEARHCCPEAAEVLKRFAGEFQMKKLRG